MADDRLEQARRIAVELENALARVTGLAQVWRDAPDPLARAMGADLLSAIEGLQDKDGAA
ncbi:hypothetical protein [Streptomyces sp. NPDC059788]|uniref:hypothetical protein n=1 Tax=Streptomyces sp. NPDC059788 TaxID=3346948 RepID=UPI0036520D3B